ncbi:uncharacterized protein PV06_00464 [Exophiala oligosperma]|uniref:Uncharacterized protein n=1 Tax=Exophiala oligosperma TaxID=215243 RepID=A0A0D2CD12_9EURO|nr:uncharacterized protein PV06_00464 [Exophiala oligosperma]KIW47802.1 hypothetical protein PV06_00464 [Exophiala oligosperma]
MRFFTSIFVSSVARHGDFCYSGTESPRTSTRFFLARCRVSIVVCGCVCKCHATESQDTLLVAMKQIPCPKGYEWEEIQRLRHMGRPPEARRYGYWTCRGIEAW